MKGTVKSKSDVERLFQTGRRSSSYCATVLAAPTNSENGQGRCAFIAGKKLGSAPLRNRCKRVLRACVFELGGPWVGFDVAFVAKHKVAQADHAAVVEKLAKQLANLGVVQR